MPLITLIAALVALRYFEVWKFAELSWAWIVLLMIAAFIWFEFVERMVGLDKGKDEKTIEKHRKARLEKTFGKRK